MSDTNVLYVAWDVHMPGHTHSTASILDQDRLEMFANNGTSIHSDTLREKLKGEMDRIKTAIAAGRTVETKSCTIWPISKEEFERRTG